MTICYLGNFSVEFSTETHIKKTLEAMGHKVIAVQENTAGFEIVELANKSDFFLWTRTPDFLKIDGNEMLKQIKVPTASYHLDLYVGLKREDGLDTDAFWKTDFVFTPDNDKYSQEVFKSKNINHFYMPPAVFDQECYIPKEKITNDIVFVGSWKEYHQEHSYRRQLVEWLINSYGERFKVYPNETTPCVRGDDLNRLYAKTKIVIGDSLCKDFKHEWYWSDRTPETLGRGGFLIHPFIVGMDSFYKNRKDLVYYKFGDFKQLKELIDYYLTHDKEREQIRLQGHETAKKYNTYKDRMTEMLKILEKPIIAKKALNEGNYQPIEIDNKIISSGWRETIKRYEIVKKHIKDKQTILDIGSHYGYFSYKIAEDFKNSFVLSIEGDPVRADIQKRILQQKKLKNIALLQKKLNLADFCKLNRTTEVIDTILMFSVIHYFAKNEIPEILHQISTTAQNLIIEIPSQNEKELPNKEVLKNINILKYLNFFYDSVRKIAETDAPKKDAKREVYLCQNYQIRKDKLTGYFGGEFGKKHKQNYQNAQWKIDNKKVLREGINLNNLLKWNVIYPDKEIIINSTAQKYFEIKKNIPTDVALWNAILSSDDVYLIDTKEGRNKKIYNMSWQKYSKIIKACSIDRFKKRLTTRYENNK